MSGGSLTTLLRLWSYVISESAFSVQDAHRVERCVSGKIELEATLEGSVLEGRVDDAVEEAWLEGEVATVLEDEKDNNVNPTVLEDVEDAVDDCVELSTAGMLEFNNVSENELEVGDDRLGLIG